MKRYKYALEIEVPNEFVRKELRRNMTNLPTRWKPIALSNNLNKLKKMKGESDRIIRL